MKKRVYIKIDNPVLVLDSGDYPVDGWIGTSINRAGQTVLKAYATFKVEEVPRVDVIESARKALQGLLKIAEQQDDENGITEVGGALALLDL